MSLPPSCSTTSSLRPLVESSRSRSTRNTDLRSPEAATVWTTSVWREVARSHEAGPEWSTRFFSLLLETIQYWGREPKDSKFKRPNQFKHLFMVMETEGVVFPTDSPNLHLFRIEVPVPNSRDSHAELPPNLETSMLKIESNLNKPQEGKYTGVGSLA